MLPGDWPVPDAPPVREPNAEVIAEVLVQLGRVSRAGGDQQLVVALLNYAFAYGIGLRRMWFGELDSTGRKVEPRHALLLDAGLLPGDLAYELTSGELFARLMGKAQSVWFNTAQRDKLVTLLPQALRAKIGGQEFFAMSVFVRSEPLGLIYADGGAVRQQLGERDYAAFK